jgi:hypoxanthine phosphoribosyltransferase
MLKVENKLLVTWDDINGLIKEIVYQIPWQTPTIDSVHGITRGGLIPAVIISHQMSLPYVNVIGPNTLVIDDIADSGKTLENSPGVYTAVLFYKSHTSTFKPNIWGKEHEGDEWLIFPWERLNSDPLQDYLNKKETPKQHSGKVKVDPKKVIISKPVMIRKTTL